MALLKIDEPANSEQGLLASSPLWRLGFRPFYLMAAAFAAISIPLWIARYYGWANGLPNVDMNWHMHEMVFGFAIAVIIGFLFTAVRAWTGLWTPRRGMLAAFVALWLAGRLAMLFAPPLIATLVDVLFVPLAAWPLYSVLKRAGNKRNMFLIVLLAVLTLLNICFHAAVLGWISISPIHAIESAILVVVILETVIGGRVIPMFTVNGIPGVRPVSRLNVNRACVILTVAAAAAWAFLPPSPLVAAFAFAAGGAQLVRLAGWKPYATLRVPLVWILHLSMLWIVVGFILLGFAALGHVAQTAAFHVLAVGSMAGLILGMITRTALGHTGRPLKAGRSETAMYVLIEIAVLARLCAAFDLFSMRDHALLAAATAWTLAFLLYLIIYTPYLLRGRLDGKDG